MAHIQISLDQAHCTEAPNDTKGQVSGSDPRHRLPLLSITKEQKRKKNRGNKKVRGGTRTPSDPSPTHSPHPGLSPRDPPIRFVAWLLLPDSPSRTRGAPTRPAEQGSQRQHKRRRGRRKRGSAGGDELLRCMDRASEKPPHKDYYKVLEVDYDASDDTIKLSYRRLALKWHPDKHKGDNDVTAKFQEINEAYTVLSDPAKRLEYDLSGCYELNRYTLREYLTRFKGMILTCNGLGIDHSSKWARHLRELEPH